MNKDILKVPIMQSRFPSNYFSAGL